MILQEEFKKNGYHDLLAYNLASEYQIQLEDIFDQKPEELLSIFISEQRDDMFFLLNGDLMDIDKLCDRWNDKIRVFTILQGQSEAIRKLKYNIVQLIIYSGDELDKTREGDLLISRKIILKGDLTDKKQIIISDDDAIELPFYMIPTDCFAPDEKKMKELSRLLPDDEELLAFMKKKQKKQRKTRKDGCLEKSFSNEDYERIKEWLER